MALTMPTMPQLPQKYQPYAPYLFPVGSMVVALLVALVFLVPAVSDIVTLKGQVDSDNDKVKVLSAKAKVLQSADQVKLNADLGKVEAALPSSKDVAGFLATFSQIAASSGSTIDQAQLVNSGKSTEKNALDFQVIVKGNFATIKGFLTKIETARRVMVVKSININLGDLGRLSADLSITGYYEPVPSGANVEAALPEFGTSQEKILSDLDQRTIYIPPTTSPSVSGRSDPFASF